MAILSLLLSLFAGGLSMQPPAVNQPPGPHSATPIVHRMDDTGGMPLT